MIAFAEWTRKLNAAIAKSWSLQKMIDTHFAGEASINSPSLHDLLVARDKTSGEGAIADNERRRINPSKHWRLHDEANNRARLKGL